MIPRDNPPQMRSILRGAAPVLSGSGIITLGVVNGYGFFRPTSAQASYESYHNSGNIRVRLDDNPFAYDGSDRSSETKSEALPRPDIKY